MVQMEARSGRNLTMQNTLVERAIPLSSPQEWRQALTGIPHSFFHTWEHSYAMHLTHHQPAYLYCLESNGVRIVCPFYERPFDEYIDIATPLGFSGFTGNGSIPELPKRWREFALRRGYICAFVNQHPLFSHDFLFLPKDTYPLKTIHIFKTSLGIEKLWLNCSEARRRALRRWQEKCSANVVDRDSISKFLLANYRDFFRRKHAASAYNYTPETIQFLLSLDHIVLTGAVKGNALEAVHMSAYTPYVAEYLFNVSLPGLQHHSAGLIWQALTDVQRRSIPFLNLGGGLADRDSMDEFKRRFGAKRYP